MAYPAGVQVVQPTGADPAIVNPLNGETMEKLQIGAVRIDRCPKTGAIWLDRGELAQLALLSATQKGLLQALDKPTAESEAARRAKRGSLKSPRTGVVMMVVSDDRQRHIEFEVDPESGGCFFDAGELADLTDYSFKERLRGLFG